MWSVYIFIAWTTCFKYSSLEGIEQSTGLEQNVSVGEDSEMAEDNLTTVDVDSIRLSLSPAFVPVDPLNYTEQLEAFFSTYNHSFENIQFINTTLHFLRASEQKMEEKIQEIKATILLLIENNGTLYINSTRDETEVSNTTTLSIDVTSTQREEQETSNITLQDIVSTDESIYGNESDVEVHTHPNPPDNSVIPTKSLPEKVADWFNSYHNYSYELDVQQEKIWIEFADFKMEDVVIVPRGFDWVFCSDRDNATLEVLSRLIHPSYPLSIKYSADFYLQILLDAGSSSYNASCFASGTMPLSVMYFDELDEPQHAVLENFLPTECRCVDTTTLPIDMNTTRIPSEL